ncbi:nicotinate-nucleotide adenylyltransferase [Flaviramulus sp. BrNp1-15]|uniref:nicotinate-nucleotide adenylyltransferase n=1 Tax=Flaviramulus sp. BrNp1-15 TaxID=2916754 RepID=UPI001EE95751|nr:nicotinate-nucleotide adenylyltransferase [Flaviramulus sp. BrNp1-15]ULC57973.1 nicotinate-nucleotide adenylyltransferase [Flaviramulus sp. BrNp1-15]
MKKLIFSLIIFSLTFEVYSQITQLPEVVITAVNYKYLSSVDTEDTDLSVQMLEEKVAMYDLKNSELYSDEYDTYTVSFYIPDGKIVAAYDKDGKILRTIERFTNVKLPNDVQKAINKRFPNWTLAKDVYSVTYHAGKDRVKKQYKVKLENGDEVVRVKLDEQGDFL